MEKIKGNKFICECCGGAINPRTYQCEYCGTQYKRDYDDQIIRIETFRSPVRTFAAEVMIDPYSIQTFGAEEASEFAVKSLARELSECIAPYMRMEHEYDNEYNVHKIRGQIKIIEPQQALKAEKINASTLRAGYLTF